MATDVVFEYITAENGTIHLARQDELATKQDEAKTLCGRRVGGWTMGDETLSGIAATCLRCKRVIQGGNRHLSLILFAARRELRDKLIRQLTGSEPLPRLAERLDVDKTTLWRVLHDDNYMPSAQMIERLLDGLGYDIEVVITRR